VSKTNTYENELLALIFTNANIANLGDATGVRGSSTAGSLFFSLHTADPGEAGDQSTSEVSYTGYARVAVARSGAGFTVTGNSVSPAGAVGFPACTAGTATATHFGIGVSVSGAGKLLYKGTVTPTISIANGVTPSLTTATAVTED
jgi:hypothetical protein